MIASPRGLETSQMLVQLRSVEIEARHMRRIK